MCVKYFSVMSTTFQRCVCRLFLLHLFFLLPEAAGAQRSITICEWNVENLFDVRHDSLKNDYEFLPEGSHSWTRSRYWRKQTKVGQTIAALGGEEGLPAIVGMCEVENDSVMYDLTRRSAMRGARYEYVMAESADRRGVDVALLYQPFLFKLLDWHSVRIPSVENGFNPTRDILYVKGCLPSSDTLHVMVCHLPSKAGGGQTSKRHRHLAAATLRSAVDSLLTLQPLAKLIVMGDFNAGSNEKVFDILMPPLRETLPTDRRSLKQRVGTYYYKKQWSYLDHMLVSDGLVEWQGKLKGVEDVGRSSSAQPVVSASESRLPSLLGKDGSPFRTYRGPYYNGGVSDHLPLVMKLQLTQ